MKFVVNLVIAFGFFILGFLVLRRIVRWIARGKRQGYWEAKGKTIVVTGASSGIGLELARQYAKAGAKLALGARSNLDAVAKECKSLGAADVFAAPLDVSKTASCQAFIKAAGAHFDGVFDSIILNAGISMGTPFEDIPEKDLGLYRQLMEVNYHGSVDFTYFALPLLKRSKAAKIVVVTSVFGQVGGPTRTGYCGSKFALHGFYESLRMEITPKYGIEITMICPGPVATSINKSRLGSGKIADIDMKGSEVMPVDVCARMIIDATATGERQLDMIPILTLGRWLKVIAPELMDRLLLRKFELMMRRRS